MRDIELNCVRLTGSEESWQYIIDLFSLPGWFGKNLDALYDMLTSLPPTRVTLVDPESAEGYGKRMLRVFRDAAAACPALTLCERR